MAVNCHHNYVDRENHFGANVLITRKGAVRGPCPAALPRKPSPWRTTPRRFYDITQILNVDDQGNVTMRDPTSLPQDLRRAMVGIKQVQIDGNRVWEVKFADKQKALDSLARYLQMFKDTLVVENVFRVVQEMDDDELDRRLAELERAYRDAKTLDPPTGEGPPRLHPNRIGFKKAKVAVHAPRRREARCRER